MEELQVIEKNNERVLLTSQIAESYGTTAKVISYNFNSNKERYVEGKHYYCLEGEEKREFCNRLEIQDSSKATKLYLWTQKGALLHAKSLGTDKAWEVYDYLVDSYFQKVEKAKQMSVNELIFEMAKSNLETEKRLKSLEAQVSKTSDKLETALNIFTAPSCEVSWKDNVRATVSKMCENSGKCWSVIYGEMYNQLEIEAGCNLSARVRKAQERMEKQGYTYKQRKAYCKLDAVADDKKLRTIFEGIIKKYQVRYLQGDNVQEYI